jgi:hypothetical protein
MPALFGLDGAWRSIMRLNRVRIFSPFTLIDIYNVQCLVGISGVH